MRASPGVIASHSGAATTSGFADKFPIGTPFTLSYTLDPEAAVLLPVLPCFTIQDATACEYVSNAPGAFSASLFIAGREIVNGPEIRVQIGNDLPGDTWRLWYYPEDPDLFQVRILFTTVGNPIDSIDFFVNTTAHGWERSQVDIHGFGDTRPMVRGMLTPEPGSVALLVLGLVGLMSCVALRGQ